MRPGYLRNSQINSRRRKRFGGLGAFGKGVMLPPPVPPGPATFKDGMWTCPGTQPVSDAEGFYTCCPSGWVKVKYGDTEYCKGEDKELETCGPRPEGSMGTLTCDTRSRQWVTIGQPVATSIPTTPEEILAPELDIEREPLVTPQLMLVGGAVFVSLIVLTLIARR